MFNPEFRYLLLQEQRNGQMLPIIDTHMFGAIFVCGINGVALATMCFLLYKLLDYVSFALTPLWNFLIPKNEWIEIVIIVLTVICCVILVIIFRSMVDELDNNFTQLKTEIRIKEERIRELEKQVLLLQKEEFVLNKNM